MDSPDDTSFLLCDEDPFFLMHNDDDENIAINSLNPRLISKDHEKEHIEYLFRREEIEFASSSDCSTTGSSTVHSKNTRLDAIDRIFKVQEELGLKLYTAYLSVMYFDRFLSKRPFHVISWSKEDMPFTIQLLSMGCLSLAAKTSEHKLPLPLPSKCIADDDQGFVDKQSMQSIGEMEVEILSTLGGELTTVTPFDFLHYFIGLFCPESRPEPLVSEAVEHVVAILKAVNLMNQKPSVIALAAILMVVFDDALTKEIINVRIGEISLQQNFDTERVFSCYRLMQEKSIERAKLDTPATTLTDQWIYTSVLDNSSVTSFTARRKLSFDNKENGPEAKVT